MREGKDEFENEEQKNRQWAYVCKLKEQFFKAKQKMADELWKAGSMK